MCVCVQNDYTYMMGTCVIVFRFFTICGKHVSTLPPTPPATTGRRSSWRRTDH